MVESKEVNAWCMPGGKVVVYTGLLPTTQNETALAIVLGHEITHAVAGHGRERMSLSGCWHRESSWPGMSPWEAIHKL
jgi:predicted Zn-dependent protease